MRAKIAQDDDSSHESTTASNEAAPLKRDPVQQPLPRKRFVVESRPLGLRRDLSFDKVEELLDLIEGPARR